MSTAPIDRSFYADPQGLSALRQDAKTQSPSALRETAKQFESLFTTMMLKSMRAATPKDSLLGSDQQDFYQDMFDQQLATQLSKGKGLGLADMLVQQLLRGGLSAPTAGTPPAGPASAPAAGAPTTANWPPASRQDFVDALLPAATAAGQKLGVDPGTLIAHAALETGWGKSMPRNADGSCSFNLFGIKAGAGWTGAQAVSPTTEFVNGQPQTQQASFRSYASPADCLQDYASLLSARQRYASALGTGSDASAFAGALQRGGYATDPQYAAKLTAVARELKSWTAAPLTLGDFS